MKKLLFLVVFSCLATLSYTQQYWVSHQEQTTSYDRYKKLEPTTVYFRSMSVTFFLYGAYADGTGAYIEFQDEPRYYIMKRLRAQNPHEFAFVIVKNREFTEVRISANTIWMRQLNNNFYGVETIYYYQKEEVTDKWLEEQMSE